MLNLPAIISLLHLALTLLANPNMTPPMRVQAILIANKAEILAVQALSTPIPIVTPAITLEIAEPTGTGAPDLSSVIVPPVDPTPLPVISPVAPQCSLSVHHVTDDQGRTVTATWTTQGIPSGTIGTLYSTNNMASGAPFGYEPAQGINQTTTFAGEVTSDQGTETGLVNNYLWKLVLGGVTCLAQS